MEKKKDGPSRIYIRNKRIIQGLICIFLFLISGICYIYYNENRKQKIYDSIHYVLSSSKSVEYGDKYNPLDLVQKTNGKVKLISSSVDTMEQGEKEVAFEIQKEDVSKKVVVKVKVNDTHPPVITLKNKEINVHVGEEYAYLDNIDSVMDVVDGDIPFVDSNSLLDTDTHYYTVEGTANYHKVGSYPITVKAVDRNGNIATESFMIVVKARPVIYTNYSPTGDVNTLVNMAYSLLGTPYVVGGNSPSGFDCSGFVSYVYSQIGVTLPRTSVAQSQMGNPVARENMLPGDILIWSKTGGIPDHVAIYVGNGQMIHAANPRKGVIVSSVSSFPETLVIVRRI